MQGFYALVLRPAAYVALRMLWWNGRQAVAGIVLYYAIVPFGRRTL
jgi:hypothetical protein